MSATWSSPAPARPSRSPAGGQEATTGKTSRQTVYARHQPDQRRRRLQDLARLVREHWSIEAHHPAT